MSRSAARGRRSSTRRGKLLYPIDTWRTAVVRAIGDTGFTETRIHDVLAMSRACEPTGSGLGRALRSFGDVLADQLVAAAGGGDALRRGAAVVTFMRKIIVAQHVLGVRFGRPP